MSFSITPDRSPSNDPLPSVTAAVQADFKGALSRAASWFLWIAGCSLVNTIILITGSKWMFLAGLGLTYVVGAIGNQAGHAGQVLAIAVSASGAAMFLATGMLARKGSKKAFLAGMIVYGADALVLLMLNAWLLIAFHAYVLWRLWQGYSTCSEAHAFEQASKPAAVGASAGN